MFKLTTISSVLFIAALINLIGSFVSWQRRKKEGGTYFALGMMSTTLWTLAAGLDYAAIPLSLKITFAKLEYAGYNIAFAYFAFFAFSYTGYKNWKDKRWVKILLLVLPISNILLAWTNEWHGLLWKKFTQDTLGENTVIFEHGPGYIWAVVTGYLIITMIIVPLVHASIKGPDLLRRQARLLILANLVTIVGNLIYMIESPELKGVDWSPLSATISGLIILLALYDTRLLDIAPIARDQLVSNMSDGMIVLDMKNRIIDVNQAAALIFGIRPSDIVGKDLEEIIPPSLSMLEKLPDQETRMELQVNTSNRYFDLLISPLREKQGKIIGRLIILRDITERKENELRLLLLTQAIEQSPISIVITDLSGQITHVNPQFTTMTGYSFTEAIGKNTNITQSGQTPNKLYDEMWQTIKAGDIWRGEIVNKKKNGELYWEFEVIAPVLDSEGKMINFVAIKEDITWRKEAEEQLKNAYLQLEEQMKEIQGLQEILREQATRDELTGLFNRHYLTETLGHEMARANREGYSITFAMLDIDHFKNINDKHGHVSGDNVLRHIAGLLLAHTRNSDIICRYGGEEFLVVLPDTEINTAIQIAERWRKTVQESRALSENNTEIMVTISCGISGFPLHGSNVLQVIGSADKALYIAKNSGRNRTIVWE